ncbi:GNAT family N-acetyltransferase [Micromonospora sp. WMMD980]|uniref:GNAT family N-acetyltransferase n=1 Tax=Micromonospora sp. WMMD980 TaxID=3016088 RepID=UPI002417DC89|nr:GNAT family N-acetyltransferase [Micromonospora sp. WMMD980]MDG4801434.1 GNAT family N-acetyltransferase [Micromonospora sp. WMMD980]
MRIPGGIVDDLRTDLVAPPPLDAVAAGRLVVRAAEHEDLIGMSRAHVAFLPIGLFPSLGAAFVRRWHRTYLDSPHGLGLVAVDAVSNGAVVGFVLGASDQAAYAAALAGDRRALAFLALAGLVALGARPRAAARLLRSRVRPWTCRLLRRRRGPAGRGARGRRASASTPDPDRVRSDPQVAVLTALAVHPTWRRSGIGMALVSHFLAAARSAGASRAEAQTSTGSLGATSFYERLGWMAGEARPTPDGDVVCTYHCDLPGTGDG